MIIQDIYLEKYNWYIRIYYNATAINADEIIEDIISVGCSKDETFKISNFLKDLYINQGLTYTNPDERCSIVVISKTSSACEFQNTLDHEKGHLSAHIGVSEDINPYSEELQYLVGDIGRKMFPVAKLFLCDSCRKGSEI